MQLATPGLLPQAVRRLAHQAQEIIAEMTTRHGAKGGYVPVALAGGRKLLRGMGNELQWVSPSA